ncbi:trace amine-associated receptor 13c-like [Sparus aurata]|uniref:trace amine-associated receptor 13c-like n=1 Tax=Sparus aurata TaxID=8175 RepID=UPI0011C0DB5C|nr:trace amine-associated receptor 13c-like [Sparus aurata]
MTDYFSQEQFMYCFPGSNASCVVKQYRFGTNFALYLVFLFGILVTIIGNSLVIVSICHFKQLHSPTNVLILSLALVDLLVGVTVMPFSATRTVHGCWFYGDTFYRHEAICNPLHYSRKITMSVAVMMHVRKTGDKNKCLNDRSKGGFVKKSECKAAKTLSIVLGAFIICWIPLFTVSIIDPLTGYSTPGLLIEVLIWLGYFNSTLNPIIYALFYPSFKKCFHCIITLNIFSSNSSNMNLTVK